MSVRVCPPGYHYDAFSDACVPNTQTSPQGGGIDPTTALQMYQQFGGSGGASSGVSGGLGSSVGQMFGGPSSNFMQFGGAEGSGGGGGMSALMSNPYSALAALIAGTSIGLDKKHVSSFSNQLQGKAGTDILDSPNVQQRLPNGVSEMLRPYMQAHDPTQWKDLPGSVWKSAKQPFKWLGKLL